MDAGKKKKVMILIIAVVVTVLLVFGGFLTVRRIRASKRGSDADRLIGVILTRNVLELPEEQAEVNRTIEELAGRGIYAKPEEYPVKRYAKREKVTETDAENGEEKTVWHTVFSDIDGIIFIQPVHEESETRRGYIEHSGPIFGIGATAAVDGKSEKDKMEGTVYIRAGSGIGKLYMNPVYQQHDGEVYVMPARNTADVSADRTDVTMTSCLDQEHVNAGDGEWRDYSMQVMINCAARDVPTGYTVRQYDADDALLNETKYAPAEMPERMEAVEGTEYMTVVTETEKGTDEVRAEAGSYEPFSVLTAREDGLLEMRDIGFPW